MMFPKDIWCLLFRNYFDCKTLINCYRAAKVLRRFMTLGQIQTCERYTEFKRSQKYLILKKTNQLQFGLCSICGSLQNWKNLSKHQRSCTVLPSHIRTDHCEKCDTPLPYVSGLAHKSCYQVMCPFDEVECKLCKKSVLRIEMESHERCDVNCHRCGAYVSAKSQDAHVCLKQCAAIIRKRVKWSATLHPTTQIITTKCSRKPASNLRYCSQHAKKTID